MLGCKSVFCGILSAKTKDGLENMVYSIAKKLPIIVVALILTGSSTLMTLEMMIGLQNTDLTKFIAGAVSLGLSAGMFLFPLAQGTTLVKCSSRFISAALLALSCAATVVFLEKNIQSVIAINQESSSEFNALTSKRDLLQREIDGLMLSANLDIKGGYRDRGNKTIKDDIAPLREKLEIIDSQLRDVVDKDIHWFLKEDSLTYRLISFASIGLLIDLSAMLALFMASCSLKPVYSRVELETKIQSENHWEHDENREVQQKNNREQDELSVSEPLRNNVSSQGFSENGDENRFFVVSQKSGTNKELIFVPSETELQMIKWTQSKGSFSSRKFNETTKISMRLIKQSMKSLSSAGIFVKVGNARAYTLGNINLRNDQAKQLDSGVTLPQ